MKKKQVIWRRSISAFLALLLCLTPGPDYEARLDGKAVKISSPYPGLLYVSLPATVRTARLEVKPRKTND